MNTSQDNAEETGPPSESRTVGSVRKAIETHAVDSLVVDDLQIEDLPHVKWAGGQYHLKAIKKALDRVSEGEVEYLAVRAPNGNPVSIGGIDYSAHEGAGTLWQLATRGELWDSPESTDTLNISHLRSLSRIDRASLRSRRNRNQAASSSSTVPPLASNAAGDRYPNEE